MLRTFKVTRVNGRTNCGDNIGIRSVQEIEVRAENKK
jgi:hypothetical protein